LRARRSSDPAFRPRWRGTMVRDRGPRDGSRQLRDRYIDIRRRRAPMIGAPPSSLRQFLPGDWTGYAGRCWAGRAPLRGTLVAATRALLPIRQNPSLRSRGSNPARVALSFDLAGCGWISFWFNRANRVSRKQHIAPL